MALPILDGNQTAATLSTVLTSGEHVPAHTVVSLGSTAIANITSAVSGVSISGTVTANVTNSVTVSSLLSAGNLIDFAEGIVAGFGSSGGVPVIAVDQQYGGTLAISGTVTVGNVVTVNVATMPAISVSSVTVSNFPATQTIAGTVTVGNSVTISSLPAISGTVTVSSLPASTVTVSALPSGALTTRFGSVTTANTAQITSAVTNTSRKYLLAQNISAGTVTIGIGFSPTTTQGIQLTAGGGLTFDSFCPTGAVYWLGAVTGAAFTILEG